MTYKEAKDYVEKHKIYVGDTVLLKPYDAICEYRGLESESVNDGTGYVQIYVHNRNAYKVPFDESNDHWTNKGYTFHKKVDVTKLSKVE